MKLLHGDCLELMKDIPDKSIDIVITDPPYGLNIDGQKACKCKNPKHNRKYHEFKGWDNQSPGQRYFDEIFRISKNQIIFGGNYFVKYLNITKGWIVWDKGQYGLTMSDGELIYTSFNKPLRIIKCNRAQLLKDKSYHPTQKPLLLMNRIIKDYTKEADIILDCFMGSGSTGIACKNWNRDFIGIEKDATYFEIAKNRIENHIVQQELL